jgi:hypothetical protein
MRHGILPPAVLLSGLGENGNECATRKKGERC